MDGAAGPCSDGLPAAGEISGGEQHQQRQKSGHGMLSGESQADGEAADHGSLPAHFFDKTIEGVNRGEVAAGSTHVGGDERGHMDAKEQSIGGVLAPRMGAVAEEQLAAAVVGLRLEVAALARSDLQIERQQGESGDQLDSGGCSGLRLYSSCFQLL